MSFRHLIPVASVVCCLGFVMLGVADDNPPSQAKINQLHAEKLLLLQDIVTRFEVGFSKGSPVVEELLAAKHDLLIAKLSRADSYASRVNLQQLIVENRRSLVEARLAAHRLGNVAEVEIVRARVGHIDAQIALHREISVDRGEE